MVVGLLDCCVPPCVSNGFNFSDLLHWWEWGQCHLVSLAVTGQCLDYPNFSGPSSRLKHVFWMLLCVCLFLWYKSLTPPLEWEDSNPLWGLMVFDPIQLIGLDGSALKHSKITNLSIPWMQDLQFSPALNLFWHTVIRWPDQIRISFGSVNCSNRSKQILF